MYYIIVSRVLVASILDHTLRLPFKGDHYVGVMQSKLRCNMFGAGIRLRQALTLGPLHTQG